MTDHAPNSLAARAALAGVDPQTEPVEVGADIARRARWAKAHNHGHPNGAWSTAEQLAVALVLQDHEHLAAMDYTPAQAAERVAGGMYYPPADVDGWLATIRAQITD